MAGWETVALQSNDEVNFHLHFISFVFIWQILTWFPWKWETKPFGGVRDPNLKSTVIYF